MKPNIFFITSVFMLSLILMTGCGSGNGGSSFGNRGSGLSEEEQIIEEIELLKTTIAITDAPSDDFDSVKVDILSPLIFTNQDDVSIDVPLPDNETIEQIDLLTLDGISDIMGRAVIPPGIYKKIQIRMANPHIALAESETEIPLGDIKFVANGVVDINLPTPFTVLAKQAMTIKLDVDLSHSLHINVNAPGKFIFRPKVLVDIVTNITPTEDLEMEDINGTIVSIPGIKGDASSFLLKRLDRPGFIPVDTEFSGPNGTTTILTALGEIADIRLKQTVTVTGILTAGGVLKARTVTILALGQGTMRGIIKSLDIESHTFTLVQSKKRAVLVSYNPDTTQIYLARPQTQLTETDLSDGQIVTLFGQEGSTANTFKTNIIFIRPERIRGFITTPVDCSTKMLLMTPPPSRLIRLRLVAHSNTTRPKIGIDFSGVENLDCEKSLKVGMPIRVIGRLVAHDTDTDDSNSVHIKAITLKQIELDQIRGTVRKVEKRGSQWTVDIPLPAPGFDDGLDCHPEKNTPCNASFNLTVRIYDFTHDPNAIIPSANNQDVIVGGIFTFVKKKPIFHAVVIGKWQKK